MNYPSWDVPIIGSGWVIGIIAIFHVLISHFAVGGGFYLPMAEAKALREGRDDWMQVIRGHAKFFLILTGVFGAVSGVGIWFSIGLAQPEATSTLIHNFVFGWAIEWVFFLVELTAAAVYYYTWGRIPARTHIRIGWIYAISAWMSLVIINGILTFMLTPGGTWLSVAGTGQESQAFWQAFFNPTYWPSLVLRTLVTISLAGIFALFTAARIDGYAQPKLKREVLRWSAKWLIPSFVLTPAAFLWYLWSVPVSQRKLLDLGISTIGQGTFTQVTRAALVTIMISATIAALVYVLAYRNGSQFSSGWAWAILALALGATASTEQAREMLRKPYVIGEHMYSNGVRKSEIAQFNQRGYLSQSMWLRPEERTALQPESSPAGMVPAAALDDQRARLSSGELMFRGQCLSCHTANGYRPMTRLLQGRDRASIANLLKTLHENKEDSPYRVFMPPLVGTENEREALAEFLNWVVNGDNAGKGGALSAQRAAAKP
ncbi:MAG: cytochrome ubiquinol oxidase subunit I [Blastocatellia bacterium]|nr:cytochrome ubiquinol oxidase subunit I [Blastocatellia bacterium]